MIITSRTERTLDPTTLALLEDWILDQNLFPILMGRLEDLELHDSIEALLWAKTNGRKPYTSPFLSPKHWWWITPYHDDEPDGNQLSEKAISVLYPQIQRGMVLFYTELNAWHWLLAEWNQWQAWPENFMNLDPRY